jgi:hypothetical protein
MDPRLVQRPALCVAPSGCRTLYTLYIHTHVRCVPCHHGMARPQVPNGGDGLQIWKVAANILNKQSRTADKGWSSRLGVGRANNSSS